MHALSGACLIEHYEKALDLHSYCPREKKLMTEEDATRTTPDNDNEIIFVTGATGYVGGRLVPLLLEAGYRVRCLVREPRKLDA